MCDPKFDLTGPVTAHSILLFRLTGSRIVERLLSLVQGLYLAYLPPFVLLWERRATDKLFLRLSISLQCTEYLRVNNNADSKY